MAKYKVTEDIRWRISGCGMPWQKSGERSLRVFKSGREARLYASGLREGMGRDGKLIHVRKVTSKKKKAKR